MHPTAAVLAVSGWSCWASNKDAAIWAVWSPDGKNGHWFRTVTQVAFSEHGVNARWQVMPWASTKMRECAWTEVPPGVWGMFDVGWLE